MWRPGRDIIVDPLSLADLWAMGRVLPCYTALTASPPSLPRMVGMCLANALVSMFAALWTENVNLLNKNSVYVGTVWCGVRSCNKSSKCCLSAFTQAHKNATIVLPLVYCPIDNRHSLFEVRSDLVVSGVSRPYCCYGWFQADLKTFTVVSWELNNYEVSVDQKNN